MADPQIVVTFGGLTFANDGSSPFTIERFDGWYGGPPVRLDLQDRSNQDGAFEPITVYRGARVMTLRGLILGTSATEAMSSLWRQFAGLNVKGELAVTDLNGTRTVRAGLAGPPDIVQLTPETSQYVVQFVAFDPLKYGPEQSQTGSAGGPTGGGLLLPPEVPGWEATGAVRTNLVRYPNAEGNNTTGWIGQGTPPATISSSTDQAHSGTRSYKAVTSGGATNEGIGTANNGTQGIASPGSTGTYTLSAWVYAPLGATLYMQVYEYVPGGALVGVPASANFTGTGAWQRVSVQKALGTGSNIFRMFIRTATSAQAITFYVDDVLCEVGSVLGAYFDGSSPDDAGPGFVYAWTGTTDASTSTQTALVPAGPFVPAPFVFTETPGNNRVFVPNAGTADTWPVFEVPGVFEWFRLSSGGRVVEFTRLVTGSQVVTIDSRSESARIGNSDVTGSLTRDQFFSIPPGGASVFFQASHAVPFTVKSRSAHL